ncbi:sporulation protein [Nocardia puris]|uniref:sporulation protein n=1 Tax=Nocardia puris TaxID=208602 RepID=UPI000A05AFE8|nr:sporulation protein [Nocardia puris]MBF6212995.1 sporulation protein [Nocardia puris]MBF6367986.1 sporulation protein [Nocardia puris]MBF6462619.1 sporulation protein [Nocardia puris]
MVFRKMLAAVGVGRAEIEVEMFAPQVRPGDVLEGVIRLTGGLIGQDIDCAGIEFVAGADVEPEQPGLLDRAEQAEYAATSGPADLVREHRRRRLGRRGRRRCLFRQQRRARSAASRRR